MGGLDIRDENGKSLGLRSPLASRMTKNITMPVSGIFLAMSVKGLHVAYDFLEHWEELTGNFFVDELNAAHNSTTTNLSQSYILQAFFEQSLSCFSLPFPSHNLSSSILKQIQASLRPKLPAKHGDLLWLIERFLLETLPAGGDIDTVSTSEHPAFSVFSKILNFANQAKYKYHPHINTLRAMAHLSEQGHDDRRIARNMLVLAREYLRPGYSRTTKHLKRKISEDHIIDSSRRVYTVSAGPAPTSAVAAVAIPVLTQGSDELGEIQDFTDNDGTGNDTDEDEDESNDHEVSGVVSFGTKRKYEKDDDDEDENDGQARTIADLRKCRFGVQHTPTIGGRWEK